jgi:hypothetical protein
LQNPAEQRKDRGEGGKSAHANVIEIAPAFNPRKIKPSSIDQKPLDTVISATNINPPNMMKNDPQPIDLRRLFNASYSGLPAPSFDVF